MAFNSITSLMILIAGSLAIAAYNGIKGVEANHANTAGSFCIINAAVYGVDTYIAVVNFKSMASQAPASQQQEQPRQQVP